MCARGREIRRERMRERATEKEREKSEVLESKTEQISKDSNKREIETSSL